MAYASNNMHYIFHREYFRGLDLMSEGNEDVIKSRNQAIRNFRFSTEDPIPAELRAEPGFMSFVLYTCYPGLLMGIGNPHQTALKGAIKLGFSLDYVSGKPYFPGSSLKGILRAPFCHPELIRSFLQRPELDAKAFEKEIFVGKDVFLGAWPVSGPDGTMLEMEYITPHPDIMKDPKPVSFMKVKPNVAFEFCFLLGDAEKSAVPAGEKLKLFKKLIMEFGIGAKTNVGFGRLSDQPAPPNVICFDNKRLNLIPEETVHDPVPAPAAAPAIVNGVIGICPNCKKDVVREKDKVICTGNCGIVFGKVRGTEVTDEQLAKLLRGEKVPLSIKDMNTGDFSKQLVYLDPEKPVVVVGENKDKKKAKKNDNDKEKVFRPNFIV